MFFVAIDGICAVAVICCSLLVDWLRFFFEYFVRPKVDSVSHTRIGQRGLNWRRVTIDEESREGARGKLAEGKFLRARLLLLILGRFLCCVEGLLCKTRAGSR